MDVGSRIAAAKAFVSDVLRDRFSKRNFDKARRDIGCTLLKQAMFLLQGEGPVVYDPEIKRMMGTIRSALERHCNGDSGISLHRLDVIHQVHGD